MFSSYRISNRSKRKLRREGEEKITFYIYTLQVAKRARG